ncbi:MAG: exodeoxyribonuclease VII large subunit [Planctomycetes bacterium]|nr:exodeoxyribonuclease VII large subunit [Planctomycetota bacterium]
MTGTVELDADGAHLLIRFPYREDLVAAVKELPGRRWDPKQKVWRVPATHAEQVFTVLSRHLFEFAPEIPSLLAGTLQAKPVERPRPRAAAGTAPRPEPMPLASAAPGLAPSGTDDKPALAVSALNALVRDGLRQLFPEAFWVVGEIVDFDKSAGRQHRFFQLVEKARGEARPLAAVEVALFASAAERLLPALERHEPPLVLRDGLEVRVLVRIDLWAATGRYQIVVQDVDPSFTLGKLALTREQILRELAQKGLAQRNRQLGFPLPARRIGVLTSPDADGWNDFLRHVQEAQVGLDVTLYPIRVQGRDLKPMLLAGLRWFAARADEFDVVCIVRGGGSRTDLAWFDDRDVALAVAQHPLKIVVGIGHQRDQSVLDAIAHSEKTPTAVAELLVRGVQEARAEVVDRARRLQAAIADLMLRERNALATLARGVHRASTARLADSRRGLTLAGTSIAAAARSCLQRAGERLRQHATALTHRTERLFDRHRAQLDQQATRSRLLDPTRVLARGFTIVRDAAGKVLPGIARLAKDQRIRVQWRDGHADAHVDHIHENGS